LGCQEDALVAIEEVIGFYQRLTADCPSIFNPDLAICLNTFLSCLHGVGDQEDALCTINDTLEVYQQLASYLSGFSCIQS
jgi:hypothetical protein